LIWWLINFLQIYFIFACIFCKILQISKAFSERKGKRIG
jgi:hypothetical protein